MDTLDRPLRYFVKIAEAASLSRAAAALDCTQPVLSRQLALLEAHLGIPLFTRTGRGMELTMPGRRLFDTVQPALAAIDVVLGELRQPEAAQGLLRLASVHTLSYYFIGDLVKTFSNRFSAVSLSMMCRSSPEVVELVETGKADAGFVYDTAVASGKLVAIPLFENRMCLVVGADSSAQHGIDLTENMPPLVGFPAQYALRRMVHSSGLQPHFAAEAETVDAMLEMVAAGMGACILPERIPHGLLAQHGLRKVRIGRPTMSRRVVLITRADRQDDSLLQELLVTALEVAQRGTATELAELSELPPTVSAIRTR